MTNLLLFDVDGTIADSGQCIENKMVEILISLQKMGHEIGIVGGGKLDKVLYQMSNKVFFSHYFTECGCVYNKNIDKNNKDLNLQEVYKKNIREHKLYEKINILIKTALNFISSVDYVITGNFIDLRNGIIYISLIGLSALDSERKYFLELDKNNRYRDRLLSLLKNKAKSLNIEDKLDVVFGGSVGIAIYPKEYDKIQIMDVICIEDYKEIHYFGDKYLEDGNDYKLLNHKNTIGHSVDSPGDTYNILQEILSE
jgi:phosphomannomutase